MEDKKIIIVSQNSRNPSGSHCMIHRSTVRILPAAGTDHVQFVLRFSTVNNINRQSLRPVLLWCWNQPCLWHAEGTCRRVLRLAGDFPSRLFHLRRSPTDLRTSPGNGSVPCRAPRAPAAHALHLHCVNTVGGVDQWLPRQSLAGALSLIFAWSMVDVWPLYG